MIVTPARDSVKLSEHITFGEFACECCKRLPPDFYFQPSDMREIAPYYLELFKLFEDIRKEWGRPLYINSGWRCVNHNQEIGGADLSAHLFGALDIQTSGKDMTLELRDIFRKHSIGPRIGWKRYVRAGRNLIHVDVAFLVSPRPTEKFRQGAEW